jgi:anti-anti-sigma regulatory factor
LISAAAVASTPVAIAQTSESVTRTEPAAIPKETANEITIVFPEILDSVAAEGMRRQILSAIDSQAATIRLDLRATKDLDVQGLAFLAALPRHLADYSHSSLRTVGISVEMATVLRVTGLGASFGILRDASRETE